MYRTPSRVESTVLRRSFDRLGIFDYLSDKSILIRQDSNSRSRSVYLMSSYVESLVLKTKPAFAGLLIGKLGKHFIPSLQCADIVVRMGRGFPYVIVNEKAERSVLYGKDVLGDSVLEHSQAIEASQLVIVLNIKREPIAIGRARFQGKDLLRVGQATVMTMSDAGSYLRLENANRSDFV
jgi:predicted ribosome-associated RNA-binding protein Tma20